MGRKIEAALWVVGLLLGSAGAASAQVTTVDDTTAADLANALTSGGAGGITITSETLSTNTSGNLASSGLFSTSGPNGFGLSGSGIVISSGDAAQDGTSGPFISGVTTNFGTTATAAQFNLLTQVSPASSSFHDVTELDITFSADANTSQVFFNTVFASAEYPHFVGSFIDGFGLFLNGTNIAFAGGDPINIDSPCMVNTAFGSDPVGVDGTAFQTTPEEGVCVENGSAVLTLDAAVTPGSTDNTLTFIIADANDGQLDTTAFIQGLGNAVPPPPPVGSPEPASIALFGAGLSAAGLLRRRKKA